MFKNFENIKKVPARNFRQVAYQVVVSDSPDQLDKLEGNVWNSGKVTSGQSSGILYKGAALESRKRYYWKVKVWTADNKELVASQPAQFEMGLLQQSDWSGDWVGFPSGWIGRIHYFRRVFSFNKEERISILFKGVLSSCDMLDRKSVLYLLTVSTC